ncbi:metalloproteinase inhibitor 2 [Nematolebias whitei]|uniref:metalloproteinase inhibitor 2 n=1 Tax=Nematolebias whitei TaxID=451745 RepID=UPI0018976CAF|nr:metalloproteinase inhibitor 2 [Nematolebias whitei]
MTLIMKSCFVSLTILLLWQVADVAEACKCLPVNLQEAFCNSDVVFSASVTGNWTFENGKDTFGNSSKYIEYDVQVIKVYKGLNFTVHEIYTSSSSASCGVTLDTADTLYLITGKLQDGKVHISLCDFIELDYDLSISQRLKLFQCETFGCGC